jgi:hypothetical protein
MLGNFSGAEIEEITPAIAKSYLDLMGKNRAPSKALVSLLAAAMSEHRFALNGQTIKFGRSGHLIDGQHRLLACIKANVPFKTWVVRGIPDDHFDTIDTGKKRTGGDILSIDGVVNANAMSGALKWLKSIETQRSPGNFDLAPDELRLLIIEYPEIHQSVRKWHRGASVISGSLASALHYLFAKKNELEADRFLTDIKLGADLPQSDPVFVLRSRLLKNKVARAKLEKIEIAALCIRAWNRRRSNASSFVLRGTVVNRRGQNAIPEIM